MKSAVKKCLFFLFLPAVVGAQKIDSTSLEYFLTSKNRTLQPVANGIYLALTKEGKGATAIKGDFVKLNYVGRLLNGTEFDRSPKDAPFVFQVGYRQVIEGLDDAVKSLKVGSAGTVFIPSKAAYGTSGVGNTIPPNANLAFEVEVLGLLNAAEYDNYMVEVEKKEKRIFIEKAKEQFKKDKKIIQNFANSHKLKTKRLDSGLSYVVTKEGKGENARAGDELEVHYEGFLADDQLFDSSLKKNTPYRFELGKGKVIEGWEEGLRFFNKGSEGWLLVPSKMAYGPRAIAEKGIAIAADAVLCFKVKIMEINRNNQKN